MDQSADRNSSFWKERRGSVMYVSSPTERTLGQDEKKRAVEG